MPTYSSVRRVPFTARQMFDLVADVQRYPEFVPYCERLDVTSRKEIPEGSCLTATMQVAYKVVSESFTTRVTLKPTAHEILVEYLDGPFSHLENRWRFIEATGGCDVDFYIEYEFRSMMLALLLGSVFSKAFERFTGIFEDRARQVYGLKPA